ncbi:MAG: hypothetical protein CM15mP58_07760 [Burkholderiaceae bacterium]|nr:MAG: hypothetical protein CM15mP58_07760 [Burkholderiaceae bacterium]
MGGHTYKTVERLLNMGDKRDEHRNKDPVLERVVLNFQIKYLALDPERKKPPGGGTLIELLIFPKSFRG